MGLGTVVLVLVQLLVVHGAVPDLDIICQIQLQLSIDSALEKELSLCSLFVVNSVTFDIDKSTVLTREELSRIDTIKRSNASADVLLTIVLPFSVTVPSVHQPLSERINIVLRDNLLDGVDLDFDIALLDYYEQLRYGQFLRRLRSVLNDKYTISTTIGCHTMGSSKALLKSFNDHLDLISVVGVNMLEDELVDRRIEEEFMLREYETEFIGRLLHDGLRPEKIVLSVLTVGIVFNPSNYRVTRSLQRSQVGILSYGQVCELLLEKEAKCGSSKRPTCSLFAGKGAIVYDSDKTVQKRVEQAERLGVRGLLILPNYDDLENVCNGGAFPLFRALIEAVAAIEIVRNELLCDGKQKYGDANDRAVYYTYYKGRFQQNRCNAGSYFNEQLQLCTSDEYPQLVLMGKERVPTTARELSTYAPTKMTSASTLSSTPNSEVTDTTPTLAALQQSFQSAMQTLDSAIAYLASIIYKVRSMVERVEDLEQSLSDRTKSLEPTEPSTVIKSSTQTVSVADDYPATSGSAVEDTPTVTDASPESTSSSSVLDSSLIPVGLPYF